MKEYGYLIKLTNGEFAIIDNEEVTTKIYSTPYLTFATIDDEINHLIGYIDWFNKHPEDYNFRTDAIFSHIAKVSIEVVEDDISLEQAYEIFYKLQ